MSAEAGIYVKVPHYGAKVSSRNAQYDYIYAAIEVKHSNMHFQNIGAVITNNSISLQSINQLYVGGSQVKRSNIQALVGLNQIKFEKTVVNTELKC